MAKGLGENCDQNQNDVHRDRFFGGGDDQITVLAKASERGPTGGGGTGDRSQGVKGRTESGGSSRSEAEVGLKKLRIGKTKNATKNVRGKKQEKFCVVQNFGPNMGPESPKSPPTKKSVCSKIGSRESGRSKQWKQCRNINE